MPATTTFYDVIDKPTHRIVAPSPSAAAAGTSLVSDLRNTEDRDPHLWEVASATALNAYNIKNDGWMTAISPALTGTFGAGASAVVVPHRGPRGTLTNVASTSQFTLSTLELSASVNLNQLANRGASGGYRIRIYDPVAGKTGEGIITANSAGTTPVVNITPALTFTPGTTASYEILSGRVYMLSAGTMAAGCWKYYDIALGVMSGNLSIVNLPTTVGTDSALLCMSESYVPANMAPGQGYFGNVTATGSSSTTITGNTTGLESALLANEFRNFQIRIISDATTPASVGQRRRISSHTAGPSVVYTVNLAWTTTPSSAAVFVIENNNDLLAFIGAQTNTYTYHTDALPDNVTADTWDTTTYAARTTAPGAGTMAFMPHGVSNGVVAGVTSTAFYGTAMDPQKNFRYSHVHSFRGGASTALDVLDIAGGATGAWANTTPYGATTMAFNTGSCGGYDGVTNNGTQYYIMPNANQQYFRYNVFARNLDTWAYNHFPTGTASVGARLEVSCFVDPSGAPKVSFLYTRKPTTSTTGASTELFESLISR